MKTILIKTKPVPSNKRFTIARGRNILSNEYRSAKEAIEWEIANQWNGDVITDGDVCVNIAVYFSGRKPDIDAYEKILLDSMTGIVYKDDGMVNEKHTFREKNDKNPRVEISIV